MRRRRLLLVAFHYPPIQGSSGVHRSLAFSRYLPEFGWDVTVLTVHPRAHEKIAEDNYKLIPPNVEVIRAQTWDAARHFSLAGRYPSALALPDRWSSWILFGTRAGMRTLRSRPFDAIFSTFPISSAHVIARRLHERSGLPWIADFRDPMATGTYPHEESLRALWRRIQDATFRQAQVITVTTPGTARFYARMYGAEAAQRVAVIENGFDPESFAAINRSAEVPAPRNDVMLLLHSGILYPRERDPSVFFRVLRRLADRNVPGLPRIHVRLRASGHEDEYRAMLAKLNLLDMVSFAPSLPYAAALAEMQQASALLVIQGRYCNEQIPAKAYEYLYAGRPILGLTDPEGDTGKLLARFGVTGIAALEDEEGMLRMLETALPQIHDGTYPMPDRNAVLSVSRRAGAQQLAAILDRVVLSGAGSHAAYAPPQ